MAEEQFFYADAFDVDRHTACEKATQIAEQKKNLAEKSGCNCEKMDFDGWRCLVRYTLKNESDAAD